MMIIDKDHDCTLAATLDTVVTIPYDIINCTMHGNYYIVLLYVTFHVITKDARYMPSAT